MDKRFYTSTILEYSKILQTFGGQARLQWRIIILHLITKQLHHILSYTNYSKQLKQFSFLWEILYECLRRFAFYQIVIFSMLTNALERCFYHFMNQIFFSNKQGLTKRCQWNFCFELIFEKCLNFFRKQKLFFENTWWLSRVFSLLSILIFIGINSWGNSFQHNYYRCRWNDIYSFIMNLSMLIAVGKAQSK